MTEILAEIRKHLQEGSYRNEEHVRFSLVGRILESLDWDIWNPRQVFPEYVPVPEEDNKKIDLVPHHL